jgi:hypothetical protein
MPFGDETADYARALEEYYAAGGNIRFWQCWAAPTA